MTNRLSLVAFFFSFVVVSCISDSEKRVTQARVFLNEGKFQETTLLLAPLTKNADDNSSPSLAFLLHGVALFELDSTKQAAQLFKIYTKKEPNDYKGYFNLGNALQKNENWEKAESAYKSALKLKDTLDIRVNLSVSLNRQAKWEEARVVLEKAMEIDSTRRDIRFNYAHSLLGLSNYDQSFYHFQWLLDKDTTMAKAWFGAGICLLMNNQRDEGCQALFKAKLLGYQDVPEQVINVCNDIFLATHPSIPSKPLPFEESKNSENSINTSKSKANETEIKLDEVKNLIEKLD